MEHGLQYHRWWSVDQMHFWIMANCDMCWLHLRIHQCYQLLHSGELLKWIYFVPFCSRANFWKLVCLNLSTYVDHDYQHLFKTTACRAKTRLESKPNYALYTGRYDAQFRQYKLIDCCITFQYVQPYMHWGKHTLNRICTTGYNHESLYSTIH